MSECCMTRDEGFRSDIAFDIYNLVEKAYQYGLKVGYSKAENDYYDKMKDDYTKLKDEKRSSYELGLNMAWEAARKIHVMFGKDIEKIFSKPSEHSVYSELSASEAIEKLRVYEEQKKQEQDEIKVGDEVAFHHEDRPDTVMFVTKVAEDGFIDGIDAKGNLYAEKNPKNWTKTGRHLVNEIVEVLKKMQEDK